MKIRYPFSSWTVLRTVLFIGGSIILLSLLLTFTVHWAFLYLMGFVGLMQVIFALTGFCPMAIVLQNCGAECGLEKEETEEVVEKKVRKAKK